MMDYKDRLIIEMTLKVRELKTYNGVQIVLSILWLFQFFHTILGYSEYNIYYWSTLIVCFIGWKHMGKKYDISYKEYEELKEEYKNYFNGENI